MTKKQLIEELFKVITRIEGDFPMFQKKMKDKKLNPERRIEIWGRLRYYQGKVVAYLWVIGLLGGLKVESKKDSFIDYLNHRGIKTMEGMTEKEEIKYNLMPIKRFYKSLLK
jgi:hypothetical protein